MANSSEIPIEAQLDVLVESLLFLVRHSSTRNMADALIADLHRTMGHDPARKRFVERLAYRLRERDEFVAENDA